jgi:hypothetical protein
LEEEVKLEEVYQKVVYMVSLLEFSLEKLDSLEKKLG